MPVPTAPRSFQTKAIPVITVAARDARAAETPTGQAADPGVFRLTRTGDLGGPLTVTYVIEGTATNGVDAQQLTGVVTFAAGSATAEVTVRPADDAVFEGDETLVLRLTDGSAYDLGAARRAMVTIRDNDPAPLVTIAATDATAAESAAGQAVNAGVFTLTRSGDLNGPLTVTYAIEGTATNGTDMQPLTGTVTFPAGSAVARVVVRPIDDSGFEGAETVVLRLLDGPLYDLGAASLATVTIRDNDPAPLVSVAATDQTATETAAGQAADPGVFTLTRTGDLNGPLTVAYTVEGTASDGGDLQRLSGTVTFAAGSATARVVVRPIDDASAEGDETVVLRLIDGPLYDLGTARQATVTIRDNDAAPTEPGDATVRKQFGGSTSDLGWGVAVGADGKVWMIGQTETAWGGGAPQPGDLGLNDGTRDSWVGAFDGTTGAQVALDRYAEPLKGPFSSGGALYYGYTNDVLTGVATDRFGNVVVVGGQAERNLIARNNDPSTPDDNTSQIVENNDIVLAKYAADGRRLWRIDIEETLSDSAYDVATGADGSIYVAAHLGEDEYGGSNPFGAALMKFDANGRELWRQAWNDNMSFAEHVEVNGAGVVFTAGRYTSRFDFAGENAYVERHRADGTTEWAVTVGSTGGADRVTGLGAGPGGATWVSGESTDFSGSAPVTASWIARVEADGTVRPRIDEPSVAGQDYVYTDLEVSADGFVFVAGYVASDGGNTVQGVVRKLDQTGRLVWESRIGDAAASAAVTDIEFDAQGDVWATGFNVGNLAGVNRGGFDAFYAEISNGGGVLSGMGRAWTTTFADGFDFG